MLAPARPLLPAPLACPLARQRRPARSVVGRRALDLASIAVPGTLASGAALWALFTFVEERKQQKPQQPESDEFTVETAFGPGKQLFEREMSSGSLFVTGHKAHGRSWRVLRFRPAQGKADSALLQSVVSVDIDKSGNARQTGEELPFTNQQVFVAVVLASLQLLGSLASPQLRLLLIGLGSGVMASWLHRRFPKGHIDVVELEPAVGEAAKQAMGFRETETLRLSIADGAAFAVAKAESVEPYDAVFVDAYDADGNIPEAFATPREGLALALQKGLLKEEGVVGVNINDAASARGILEIYGEALAGRDAAGGAAFSVRELDPAGGEGEGNLLALRAVGAEVKGLDGASLKRRLNIAAKELQVPCEDFDLRELALRGFKALDEL